MKTINRTIDTIKISDVHFIKDVKENKLYEVTPVNVFIPVDGEVQLVFKNGDEEQSYGIKEIECYTSRLAYETGAKPMSTEQFDLHAIQREDHFVAVMNDTGEYELTSVIMKNGVPTKIDAPILGFLYRTYGAIKQVIWEDGVDVKLLYDTTESAIMYNNYKYTNEQGEEVEREGTRAHVLLNGKQKKAFEEFKKALKELNDANVFIVMNEDNYEAAAINGDSSYCEWDGEEGGLHPDYLPEEQTFTMRALSTYYGGNNDMHIYEKETKK